MFNKFFRLLLTATSFSPVFGALAITYLYDKNWLWAILNLLMMGVLIVLCLVLMRYALSRQRDYPLFIKESNKADHGIIVFLFVYLVPFVRSPNSSMNSELLMIVYVSVIVFCVFVDVDAYNFNPIIRLCGYRFYAVKDNDGIPHLLIIKGELREIGTEIRVTRFSDYVWICEEEG